MQRTLVWKGHEGNDWVRRQVTCDTLCNKCVFRFKCYILLQGEALLLDDREWKVGYVYNKR